LGINIDYLSIPGGFFNDRILRISREVGYRAVCTSAFGVNSERSNCFALKRMGITFKTPFEDFMKMASLDRNFMIMNGLRWTIKNTVKGVIGKNIYTILKNHYTIRKNG
jgi:hypothetical protein